jgi:hypothetical protein
MAEEKKTETKPRKLPLEKTDDLAEGEPDTVDDSIKEHERKKDQNS